MTAVAVVLAVLVGVSLGLLGGGGSILTVPLLAYVAGMEAKQAIATSLVVVGVTSTVSAMPVSQASEKPSSRKNGRYSDNSRSAG